MIAAASTPWPAHAWGKAASAAWVPRPRLRVSEWAERYRVLPPPACPDGPWRAASAPYLTGIMDALNEVGVDTIAVMIASQMGKALALDTPIPTPTGWAMMGDIMAGDEVFGPDGRPATVVAVSPVMMDRPCYRVTFGDGSTIIADGGHRWYVEPSNGLHGRVRRPGVMTTEEIRNDLHIVNAKTGKTRNAWGIPVAGPLELDDKDLPINPYALGIWLGDGNSAAANVTSGDQDIEELLALLHAEGVETRHNRSGSSWSIVLDPKISMDGYRGYATKAIYARNCYLQRRYSIKMVRTEKRESMYSKLSRMGLLNNKHVPVEYLRGSKQQRLALLQGLMDSDGCCTALGLCEFCSTDRGLAESVRELALSVGLKPTLKEGVARLNGMEIGPKYRVTFIAYSDVPVFRLKRKLERQRSKTDKRARPSETMRRFITDIVPVPSVPVRCIGVDSPSSLFLAGRSMIPTHNTEVELNILGYFVDQDPSPILYVQPTIEAMEHFSKERIETSFRASPALRHKLETGQGERGASRKSSQTIRLKMFPGGYLAMAGANAPAGLASRPIRVVLCDEIDRFPVSAGVEGDPIALAFQRTANFEHNRKRVLVSTPTIAGASKIETWHDLGDQRRYHVPCPHCGELQVLRWERLRFTRPDGTPDLSRVTYQCEACDRHIEERHKHGMVAAGRWIATVPGGKDGTGKIVSFGHLSALYSPWAKWATLAAEWVKAHDTRDRKKLKEFTNVRLGLPFVEHEHVLVATELDRLREDYPRDGGLSMLPAGVRMITAGVDVQGNRLEVEAVGWGEGRESWGVQYAVLPGDPDRREVWQALDAFLARTWLTEDGRLLGVACTAVDSGDGNRVQAVYAYCRERQLRKVFAVKGKGGDLPIIVGGKATYPNGPDGAALYTVGADEVKSILMSRLVLEEPGPGYCHLPRDPARGYKQEWFEQLLSEHLVPVTRGGKTRMSWELPRGSRNEALDCRVYATAAAEIHGADLDGQANAYSWL